MDLRTRDKEDSVYDGLPLDANQDQPAHSFFGGVDRHQQGRGCPRREDDALLSIHTATPSSEAPVSALLSIPQEVLLSILQRLSIEDLLRCQTVCSRLRTLCRTTLLDVLSVTAASTMFFVEFTPNDGRTVRLHCASVDRVKEELLYKPVSNDSFLTITLDMRPRRSWTAPIGSCCMTSLGPPLPRLLSHPAGPSVGLNLFDYQTGLRREVDRPFGDSLSGGAYTLLSHARRSAEGCQEDIFTTLSIRHGMWRKEANIISRWDQSWEMDDHDSDNGVNAESMVCLTSDLHYPRDNSPSAEKRGVVREAYGEPPSKIHRHFVGWGGLSSNGHGNARNMNCRCCLHHKPLRAFAAGSAKKRTPATLTGTRDWCLEYSLEILACCPCVVCRSRGLADGINHGSQEEEEEDDGRREVRVVMGQLRVSLDWVLSGMKEFKPISKPMDACHQNRQARDALL